jgi:NitT/TauT family transport system ATP-binding protein
MEKGGESMKQITFNKVQKKFGSVEAISHIETDIHKGEFVSLIGPSGCGKTTLLKVINGLVQPSVGEVTFETFPNRQAMVFQDFSLFPWLNVKENIAFGLKLQKIPHARASEKILKEIGLQDFAQAFPDELSGGMRQRVALASALVINPDILLMDEPFGALDPITKQKMQELLVSLWQKYRSTIVFVTHDIEEAIYMSDRIIVMDKPAKIIEEIQVPFKFPRDRSIKQSKEFLKIKEKIHGLLENKMS